MQEISAELTMRKVVASILRGVFGDDEDMFYVADQENTCPAERLTTRRLSDEAPIFVFDDPLADYGVPPPTATSLVRSRSPQSQNNLRGMARLRAIAPLAIVTDILDAESFVDLAGVYLDRDREETTPFITMSATDAARDQKVDTPEAPATVCVTSPGIALAGALSGPRSKGSPAPDSTKDHQAFLGILR
ncbi:unnamed protein product [Cyclocybe aegerita]|uniref:Uncharacterized protein n=1 Tax=Cyclocybe aegerita TaxID=1973307 RepID=A0A8S0W0T0_CYCAE|nr:unnamed protein product [Cyclocybe aegerita]